MSDDRQKLAQMKQRLQDFRREHAPPPPRPDPFAPHDPYHLPYTNMDPSRMPTAADAAKSGAGFLQAEMTAQVPMALFNNLPPRLMNDFYQLTWDMSKGRGDLHGFIEKFHDYEIDAILQALDSFPLENLHASGVKFYEALIEASERRNPRQPTRRVRIATSPVHDDKRDTQIHDGQFEAHEEPRALPARTFPGPLLKPRS